ncbi:acetate--CoA ligase family protein [Profundibacter sp.]
MTHAFKNLDVLLNPASIAVVGASDNPLKIGGRPIDYMKKLGFKGIIYPVNPNKDVIQGFKAYPALSAIGQPIDLAIIAAPAKMVEDMVADGLTAGVKSFVIFSSGYGEFSADGAAAQERLQKMCDDGGAVLLGPNCLGAINIKTRMVASFTTAMEQNKLIEGGFGFVSQSGALGAYWLDMVLQRGIGVSSWVATGNEAGITVSDAIYHLAHDPDTKVIGCYIEDIKDGAAFRKAALVAAAAGKPILLIKAGRSESGAAAAASHTGALAGEDTRYQALFDQIGIVRVNSLSDMTSAARLMLMQPAAMGRNVGVVSVSGGAGVLLADELDEAGFAVPAFDSETRARVDAELPGFVAANNPLDVTGGIAGDPSVFGKVLNALGTAPDHDSFIIFIGLMASISKDLSDSLVAAFSKAGKQVMVVWVGAPQQVVTDLESQGLPVFPDIPEAVRAMEILRKVTDGQAKAKALASKDWPLPLPSPKTCDARSEVMAQRLISDNCGLQFPKHVLLQSADDAASAFAQLTPPLVVKLQSPDMLHKSEHGGVALGIQSQSELATEVQRMLEIANKGNLRLDGILAQEMAPISQELIIGFKRDAVFGPLILIGRGGVEVELRPDRVLAYLPLGEDEILALLQGLETALLFEGYRGGPQGDLRQLAQNLSALGAAFIADESIEEIEINPLALTKSGDFIALDALSLHRR